MAWNKCSEKLPEVGMLVITRAKVEKYDPDIETDEQYKYRLLCNYSIDGYDYAAGTVTRGSSRLYINVASGEYHTTLMDDLEWKEVEKD